MSWPLTKDIVHITSGVPLLSHPPPPHHAQDPPQPHVHSLPVSVYLTIQNTPKCQGQEVTSGA